MSEHQGQFRSGSAMVERVSPDPIHPKARAMEVIDTDFHVLPEFSTLRPYFQEPFQTKLQVYPQTGNDYRPAILSPPR